MTWVLWCPAGPVSNFMQKTLVAGIPLLAAVSAPSSLAVQLAQEFDMSLVGFFRGDTFNIYAGEERISE